MPEDDIINNNTPTSSLHIHRRMEISVGNGQSNHYFNGHIGLENSVPDLNIRTAFSETAALVKKNIKEPETQKCSALMCMVRKNEIVIARSGKDQRAIFVYKNDMGLYQRIVLADDEANRNDNPFHNPEILKHNISKINLSDAYIITGSSNFFGKGHNCTQHFDSEILTYLNADEKNKLRLNNMVEDLKNKAIAKNKRINDLKTLGLVDNANMIVCINRVIPGVITGIVSQNNYAKSLHESLMFQSAIVEMQTIVNSNQTWQQKMLAINEFRSTYIKLPWWKEHSYILTLIAIVALGMIFGGLFGGPLFLPALFLKTAHAAAAEGAIMGVGLTLTGASAHFACHYYRYKNKTPEQAKEEAITDQKRYPSPSLCVLS